MRFLVFDIWYWFRKTWQGFRGGHWWRPRTRVPAAPPRPSTFCTPSPAKFLGCFSSGFCFKYFSHHNFPVAVGQKPEDPLEDLCWQCAVDTPCSHFGLTLLKLNLSGFMKGFFLGNKVLNLFVSVERSSDSGGARAALHSFYSALEVVIWHIWATWPEPRVKPEYLKSDSLTVWLFYSPTCQMMTIYHLTCWPSDHSPKSYYILV